MPHPIILETPTDTVETVVCQHCKHVLSSHRVLEAFDLIGGQLNELWVNQMRHQRIDVSILFIGFVWDSWNFWNCWKQFKEMFGRMQF